MSMLHGQAEKSWDFQICMCPMISDMISSLHLFEVFNNNNMECLESKSMRMIEMALDALSEGFSWCNTHANVLIMI